MTSWWTSLKAFLGIEIGRKKYFSNMDSCQSFIKIGTENDDINKAVREFMKVVYTIGNFCPVPEGFNTARSGGGNYDYWDLTLMKIRDWYQDKKEEKRDEILRELLHHTKEESDADKTCRDNCKEWLEWFEKDAEKKKEGNQNQELHGQEYDGWHNFVDTLYMQDYVYCEENKIYKVSKDVESYKVIPFWDGHEWDKGIVKKTFPTDDKEQVNAFKTMAGMICARSERIAQALVDEKTKK